jgi:PPP family 3-phenylpropionic acid transporter
VAFASAAGTLVSIPGGILSDRLHRRHPFIVGGSLLMAACFVVYPSIHQYAILLAVQSLIGIGGAISLSVASALGADHFQQALAGRSFAWVRSWGTVGFLLILGITFLRPDIAAGGLFLRLTAALCVAAALSVLLISRPMAGGVREVRLRDAGELLMDRNLRAFMVVYLLGFMSLMPATANLSLYMQAFEPRPAPSMIPLVYAVSAACELPFLMAMGWMADRFGRVLPMRICFVVLPVRLAFYAFVPDPYYVLALQATHGLTFSVLAVVPFAFVADSVPRRLSATGQAMLNAAGGLANTIGPIVAGRAADVLGIRSLYLVLGGIALVGSLVLFARVIEPVRSDVDVGLSSGEDEL